MRWQEIDVAWLIQAIRRDEKAVNSIEYRDKDGFKTIVRVLVEIRDAQTKCHNCGSEVSK